MNRRDVLIGLVALALIGFYVINRAKNQGEEVISLGTPTPEERIEDKFNLTLDSNEPKADLSDVSGGDGAGIATRDAVLADLPDTADGSFYQAWVIENGVMRSLGKMRLAKGGYLFDGVVSGQTVIISRETIFDNQLEVKILEGNF